MEAVLDIILDALIDTAKMLPFLFAVYLLIEYLEHKASDKLANSLRRLGPFGPVGGALFGCIPQCGFSVAVSNLYSGRLVSLGTLIAVYIATSDEAVPILLSNPLRQFIRVDLPTFGLPAITVFIPSRTILPWSYVSDVLVKSLTTLSI
jgi:hypothetical protein